MNLSIFLKKENNNLDLIRIFLASMVIYGHTNALNGYSNYWYDPILLFFKFTYSGSLAVKIFFFISGMVVTNSFIKNPGSINYIFSRIFRILPGLFFVVFITSFIIGPIISHLTIFSYFKNIEVYKYFFQNIFTRSYLYLPEVFTNNLYKKVVNGSLWTLAFEGICYIVLFIYFKIAKTNFTRSILPVILISLTLFFPEYLIKLFGNDHDRNLLPISFATGSLFAINANKIHFKYIVVTLFLIISGSIVSSKMNEPVLLCICFLLVLIIAKDKYFIKLHPTIDISYGIYLWGFFIQQLLYNLTGHINNYSHFFISIILSILIALISSFYIELPFIKKGKYFSLKINKFLKINQLRN